MTLFTLVLKLFSFFFFSSLSTFVSLPLYTVKFAFWTVLYKLKIDQFRNNFLQSHSLAMKLNDFTVCVRAIHQEILLKLGYNCERGMLKCLHY